MVRTKKNRIVCKHCKKRKNTLADDGTPMPAPIRCRNCTKLQQKVQKQKIKQKNLQRNKNSKLEENIRNIVEHLNEIKVQVKNDVKEGIATATDVKPKVVDFVELSSDEDDDDSPSSCNTKYQGRVITSTGGSTKISVINDTINLDDTAVDEVANNTLNFADVSTQSEDCIVITDSDSNDSPIPMPRNRKVKLAKEIDCIAHLNRTAEDSVLEIGSPEKESKIRKVINKPSQKVRMKNKKQKRLLKQQLRKSMKETKLQLPKAVQLQKPQTPKQQVCESSKSYCNAEEFWGPAVVQPFQPKPPNIDVPINERPLRQIVVDGQNVARGDNPRGNFSVRAIQLVVEYFQRLGHKIVVFLPNWCQAFDDGDILRKLEYQGILIYTPSRKVKGQRIQPYDDRYIIDYASRVRGLVISRDQFRDLVNENEQFQETIESRLLPYTFIEDVVMFPYDPMGKRGPSLAEFLRLTPQEMQQGNQETSTGVSTTIQGMSSGNQATSTTMRGTSSGNQEIFTANQGTSSGNQEIFTATQGTSILFKEKPMAIQGTSILCQEMPIENQGISILYQEKPIEYQGTSSGNQEMLLAKQETSVQVQQEKQEVSMEVSQQEKEEQSPPLQDESEADISVVVIN